MSIRSLLEQNQLNLFSNSLSMNAGSDKQLGLATLVGGTVTVSNINVQADSNIFVCAQTNAGTPGFLGVTARTPGVSFDITSSSNSDTSDVSWLIMNPAS